MTYALIIWIAGCVGPDCPIPTYEVEYFTDIIACERRLDLFLGSQPKWYEDNGWENKGACLRQEREDD